MSLFAPADKISLMSLSTVVKEVKVSIGDTINVSQKIVEGEKERIQNFEGVLIAIKGESSERTITVRKIGVGEIGVEKIFPTDLPSIAAIKVIRSANVKRSKLYYLRNRTGKAALQLDEVRSKKKTVKKIVAKKPEIKEQNVEKPKRTARKTSGKAGRGRRSAVAKKV